MSQVLLNSYLKFGVSVPFWEDSMTYATQGAFDTAWAYINALTRGNPTTDVIDFNIKRDGINASISYNLEQVGGLGVALDDTAFVYRSKLVITTQVDANLNVVSFFGTRSVPSSTPADVDSDQDSLTVMAFLGGAGAESWNMIPCDHNRETSSNSVFTFSTEKPIVETQFWEIIRLSSTAWSSASFGTDSTYTTAVEDSGSVACASTIINQKYVGIFDTNQDGYTGQLAGTYSLPKAWSGVTSPP